jgi:hypothetical protein
VPGSLVRSGCPRICPAEKLGRRIQGQAIEHPPYQ